MPAQPTQHRSHDYRYLIRCWREFCREAGLQMRPFIKQEGLPVYVITSPETRRDTRETLYISAGVHGDEAAPPWGLLEWAKSNVKLLQTQRLMIFPVMNPQGLMLNTRADYRGIDINRHFNSEDDPLMLAWRKLLEGRRISLALCLHEDYDGQGCYIYELTTLQQGYGQRILRDTSRIIPADARKKIDGRAATAGLIIRRIPPEMTGLPEAIVLHYLGAPVSMTFESPSEFSLTERVAVQKAFLESSLKHIAGL
jgi:murein peptide amidase A